jgi:hypothetical protein
MTTIRFARRFAVDGAVLCGVHVPLDGTAILESGSVRGCAIGACIQSDAQRLADLVEGVAYADNGLPLDTTTLAVPEPIDEIPE